MRKHVLFVEEKAIPTPILKRLLWFSSSLTLSLSQNMKLFCHSSRASINFRFPEISYGSVLEARTNSTFIRKGLRISLCEKRTFISLLLLPFIYLFLFYFSPYWFLFLTGRGSSCRFFFLYCQIH